MLLSGTYELIKTCEIIRKFPLDKKFLLQNWSFVSQLTEDKPVSYRQQAAMELHCILQAKLISLWSFEWSAAGLSQCGYMSAIGSD